MSKHNYSQYSKKSNNSNIETAAQAANENTNVKPHVDEIIIDDVAVSEIVMSEVVESPIEVKMEPVVAEPVAPKSVIGTVFNCSKLNVRTKPIADADVVCVIDSNSEVEIDMSRSTKEWFKICTATGVEGFCMRKFVKR